MRWLALGLCCLLAAPAGAQSWATRALCLEPEPKIHAGAFAPATYEEIQQLAVDIPNGTGRFWRIEGDDGTVSHLWGTMHSNLPRILDLPDAVSAEISAARMVALALSFLRAFFSLFESLAPESAFACSAANSASSLLPLPPPPPLPPLPPPPLPPSPMPPCSSLVWGGSGGVGAPGGSGSVEVPPPAA